MPMPELDPSRYVEAVLADPSHKLPLPDRGGRLFLAEGEVIDTQNSFYATLLADGSLKVKAAPIAPEVPDDKPVVAPAPAERPSKGDAAPAAAKGVTTATVPQN